MTKPYVICHMVSSLDGSLAVSKWTASPDGDRNDWSAAYAMLHETLKGEAWMVGRVTMAEMTKAAPHPPAAVGVIARPVHVAARAAPPYAIALDRSGKLHFDRADIDGDHIVTLLGHDVPDAHLAELIADGISYVVADDAEIDLAAALDILGREFGIKRLLLEGGGGINGSFFLAGLVDELSVLMAPALDGRADARAIVEAGAAGLAGRVQLSLIACEAAAHGTVHLRYAVKPA
ncbi:MAG: riboflavin deaminase [Tardiphaga sp.]|jgi:riboflavin biosynthesis pyrimidine reductase|nr:riboflavin deaminase [Tardiphaga sp.]